MVFSLTIIVGVSCQNRQYEGKRFNSGKFSVDIIICANHILCIKSYIKNSLVILNLPLFYTNSA